MVSGCWAISSSAVIGALLGGFLLGLLGITTAGLIGNLISAFIGAVVLLALIGFIKRKGA